MIRSMTGYGAAERTDDQVRVAVEIRTINNRFFKLIPRLPDGLGAVEVAIERLLRAGVSRGTVNVGVKVEPRGPAARVPVNTDILAAYKRDLALVTDNLSDDALLALPGVLGSEDVLLTGIEGLQERIEAVRQRAPAVVNDYRARLQERVQTMIEGAEITVDDQSLIREVAFFAERSDINEELARLASHVGQFRELLADAAPLGRKLEFLTQEMYREVNTIGAKANDPEVSREVVEIKVGVDRLREHTQNIE